MFQNLKELVNSLSEPAEGENLTYKTRVAYRKVLQQVKKVAQEVRVHLIKK